MTLRQSASHLSILAIGICIWSVPGFCQKIAAAQKTTFRVGGVSLALPAPGGEFAEVGDESRSTVYELAVPMTNRLVSAYALSKDLPLSSRSTNAPSTYAMVEVLRRAEYWNCSSEEFVQAASQVMDEMSKSGGGSLMSDARDETQEEINRRLQSLDLGKMEIGSMKMIGSFFSKTDASGVGMLAAVKYGNQVNTIAMSMALLRVKQRVLFLYFYAPYKDANTILWLRHTSESWADALLAANR